MTFFRSIVLLVSVSFCIAFAYFFGHGLAVHEIRPLLYSFGFLLAGIALIALLARDRVRGGW
jgi:hypothetical protein